jgi:hypothetical protein
MENFRSHFPKKADLFLIYKASKGHKNSPPFQHIKLHNWSHETFPNMTNWAHSSVSLVFGRKLHNVLNSSLKSIHFSFSLPSEIHGYHLCHRNSHFLCRRSVYRLHGGSGWRRRIAFTSSNPRIFPSHSPRLSI